MKRKAWISTIDGKEYQGISTPLDALGQHGWEMVSMVAAMSGYENSIGYQEVVVVRYLAVFKRPINE
jgi:hypothetical protein